MTSVIYSLAVTYISTGLMQNGFFRNLPFPWLEHAFMRNAFLAVLLVTPVFGIIGTMVVNNRMAFFSESIGHSAFTGIAIGVILGISNPLWSMVAFSIVLSFLITAVKSANTASMDTIIGVFSSTSIALGLVILSRKGFGKFNRFLIGDLLSITRSEIVLLILIFIGVILFWAIFYNRLLVISINRSLAASRGINVRLTEAVFTAMVAVIVTVSIQWIGILIINSLLILPAAAARNISRSARQYHLFSVSMALTSGISGLILSYYWGTAAGATIVLVSAAFFAVTFILKLIID